MIRRLLLPGLLDTGTVQESISAIRNIFVNFYVVRTPEGVLCFDAGWHRRLTQSGFRSLNLDPQDVRAVFLTHEHWDHARGSSFYPNARIFTGRKAATRPGTRHRLFPRDVESMRHGQTMAIGNSTVRAIETPGHTAGSMAFLLNEQYLFTGDTVRLLAGQAYPFPSVFNRDSHVVRTSLQTLAGIPGVKMLFTAHSGCTANVTEALRRWREPAP